MRRAQKYLVFGGKTGWIGGQLIELLKKQGKEVAAAESRIENLTAVAEVSCVGKSVSLSLLTKCESGIGFIQAFPRVDVSRIDWKAQR